MRTVDPELWYRKVKKPRIQVTRSMRYGLQSITGTEYLVRASFVDAMTELRNNCSVRPFVRVHAFIDQCEKAGYKFMLILVLCTGVCVVGFNAYQIGNKPPLLISPQSNQRSVHFIDFPAVGLCSNYIFSSKALHQYTKYLDSKDNNSTYTEEEIRANLMKFGALLNLALPTVDVMFINFLTRVHKNFNVTDLMFRLSPKCTSILRRCSWRGRLMPCDRLFGTRITPLGFCCVFNSRYQPEDVNTPPKILDLVGQDFGLSFLVKSDEDFVYARRPSVGYELMVFDGSEYPLIEGGGVRLYPLERLTSLFLTISARAEQPSRTLNYYNEKWVTNIYGNARVSPPRPFAAQVVGQQLRVVPDRVPPPQRARAVRLPTIHLATYCAHGLNTAPLTAPHTAPHAAPHTAPGADADPLCNTNHLPCLNKHREKLLYYYPGESADPSLGEEVQSAQECEQCVPDCARRVYSAALAHKHYRRGERVFQNFVSKGVSLVNASVVRVFYTSEHQQLFSVEANLRWYEAVALLASQWISVVGVTIVFVAEIVFYCTIRWAHHYRRRARITKQINTKDKP